MTTFCSIFRATTCRLHWPTSEGHTLRFCRSFSQRYFNNDEHTNSTIFTSCSHAALTAPLPYTASKSRKPALNKDDDLPRAVLFDMTNEADPSGTSISDATHQAETTCPKEGKSALSYPRTSCSVFIFKGSQAML